MANLELALSVPDIPEITQTLLNLAEFVKHCKEASVSGALIKWDITEWALIEWALGGGLYKACTLMLPLLQGHLTLNPTLLEECAMTCGAYTKALHYK